MAIPQRQLSVSITMGAGNFGDAGSSNTITIPDPSQPNTGLWMSALIQKGVSPATDVADLRIWGLPAKTMNQLSYLGKPIGFTRMNTIVIKAGDADGGLAIVFQGIIQNASQDFRDAPQVAMNLGCQALGLSAMAPVSPLSVKGSADVATLFQQIAASMQPSVSFENNGVSQVIVNPYLPGTAKEQMDRLADAAGVYAAVDSESQVLAIWPKGQSRGGQVPLISKATGMVGYPMFADVGIGVRSIYFPGVRVGAQVQVQSEFITGANKTWYVATLSYDLDTSPSGAWFMDLTGYLLNNGVPQ